VGENLLDVVCMLYADVCDLEHQRRLRADYEMALKAWNKEKDAETQRHRHELLKQEEKNNREAFYRPVIDRIHSQILQEKALLMRPRKTLINKRKSKKPTEDK